MFLNAVFLIDEPRKLGDILSNTETHINKEYQTALFPAVSFGAVKCTRALLKAGANVNKCDTWGQTPLFFAAEHRSIECTRILIDHKANVNIKDVFGYTALHKAARDGISTVVKMLIKAGAEVDPVHSRLCTPLQITMMYKGLNECGKLLINYGAKLENIDKSVKIPDWAFEH